MSEEEYNNLTQEEQTELEEESKRNAEEDHDMDGSQERLNKIPDMTFWEEQSLENELQGSKCAFDDYEEDEQ